MIPAVQIRIIPAPPFPVQANDPAGLIALRTYAQLFGFLQGCATSSTVTSDSRWNTWIADLNALGAAMLAHAQTFASLTIGRSPQPGTVNCGDEAALGSLGISVAADTQIVASLFCSFLNGLIP